MLRKLAEMNGWAKYVATLSIGAALGGGTATGMSILANNAAISRVENVEEEVKSNEDDIQALSNGAARHDVRIQILEQTQAAHHQETLDAIQALSEKIDRLHGGGADDG